MAGMGVVDDSGETDALASSELNDGLPPLLNPFVEEIDINDIEHIQIVGKGSFGTVYKACWRKQFVAVKYFDVETERNAFIVEIRQLSRVAHPNIVGLFGACTKSPHVCLVMEFAECGSLYTALHRNRRLGYTIAHAMCWAQQCARGVAYLHSMRPKALIHRDLKSPNLLLVAGGAQLKICDFGTVTDKATLMTNNKGSAAWMAPEVFEGSTYTERCDVYSWGIILWELLARQQPFQEIELLYSIMWSVHTGHRPPLLEQCPAPVERLITSCWDQQPERRPAMEEVVEELQVLQQFAGEAVFPLDFSEEEEDDVEDEEDDGVRTTEGDDEGDTSTADEYTDTNRSVLEAFGGATAAATVNVQRLEAPRGESARWASPEARDNSMPRIISEPLKSFAGTARLGGEMQQLSVACDANAWDLDVAATTTTTGDEACAYAAAYERRANNHGHERLTVAESKTNAAPSLLGSTSSSTATSSFSGLQPSIASVRTVDLPPAIPFATTTSTSNSLHQQQQQHHHQSSSHHIATISGSGAAQQQQHQQHPSPSSSSAELDIDLDSMYMMLEPNLRPATPDPNSRVSQQIYDEHNDLAREYLKVQTEIAYKTKHREELLAAMDADQRRERLDFANKLIEKEALVQLEANLKLQLQLIRTTVVQQQQQQQGPNNPGSSSSAAPSLSLGEAQSANNGGQVPATPEALTQQRLEEDGWVFASK